MFKLSLFKKNRRNDLDRLPLINYYEFENEFRGSKELIVERQQKYVRFFDTKKNVLDIGCGRGEFLNLMKKNRIGCLGIDNNREMIKECKKQKLPVKKIDLFEYLLNCPNKYHDGIISLQVVEHLTSRRVQNFVKLCWDKVKSGSYVVVETVNPLCLQALAHFWADLTHEKPLVPYALQHVFKQYGFKKVSIVGRTPILPHVPDFITNPPDMNIYGDYAIVALK